jgi:hypothetical protein
MNKKKERKKKKPKHLPKGPTGIVTSKIHIKWSAFTTISMVIPAFGRLKQEDFELKALLGYVLRPSLLSKVCYWLAHCMTLIGTLNSVTSDPL